MQVKFLYSLFFSFSILVCHSQINHYPTFGEITQEEFSLNTYAADPEAPGVVLYEKGNYTVDQADGYIRLIKEVHCKIKVFDAKNFNHATVEIPYLRWKNVQENITKFKAITHNGPVKKYVGKQAIFNSDMGGNWSVVKFTFPDVKDGSILEYIYRIETPSLSNLGTWTFMNELPTIYSELHTEIPGNYQYNRTLRGTRELDLNHAEIKKSCFHLPGFRVAGDCEVATYAMKDIPAFKKERYMLSSKNYIPSLKFELAEMVRLNQTREVLSKSWSGVDRHFRRDKDLGGQLSYSKYFKRNMPESILSIPDDLERAKAVYYFVQDKIKWNKRSGFMHDVNVREAFKNGVGNGSEINLTLINALEAAGLDAKAMAIATRDSPLPTKQHPVITDFNYAIVFVTINNQKYFLDATEEHSQFGVLPIRALNLEGRVLDFKNGSYWEPIVSFERNMHYINMQLETDSQGVFSGKIKEMSTGQIALPTRRENSLLSHQEITKAKQSANEGFDISEYQIENAEELEQAYTESYNITLPEKNLNGRYFIYPFLMENYFDDNPFHSEIREYPINLGFPVTNNYLVSIDLKDQYEIVKVPSNRILKLPLNDGELSVVYEKTGDKVNIRLNVRLNAVSYAPEAHQSLSEFFQALIKIRSEEPIELRKI